jgi:putative ABC transport system ATP-binding protein
MSSQPRVELERVSKHYGDGPTRVDALTDITLEVGAGETVGLLGPSGCGKTTLLNVIGCITEPNTGWMRLDGQVVYDGGWLSRDLRRLRLEKIGFIFQTHNLLPFLNSTENVAEAMELRGVPQRAARERAENLLEYLEVGHRRRAMPGALSGGEAQRVAIARALANDPHVILADEPTAALDSKRAGVVMGLLRKVAAEQEVAVLVVTHDEKIFGQFDRVIRLRDGFVEDGASGPAASPQAA